MNIFTIFFDKIVAKYTPKRTKLHHFLKEIRGSMPPTPLRGVPRISERGAKNFFQLCEFACREALLGRFGGMLLRRIFLKTVQFGAF